MAPQGWGNPSLSGDALFPQDGDLPETGDPSRLGTPLSAWRTPPNGASWDGDTPPSMGTPPVREHPQDGDTPQNGDPLTMEPPLPAWGPPLQNGDLPQDEDTTFLLTPGWQVLPAPRVGSAWVAGRGLDLGGQSVSLVLGGSTDTASPHSS